MEIIYKNYFDTSTMMDVDSNTATVDYLLNKDKTYQYKSSGYLGATTTTLKVNFSSTQKVSRIVLCNHNFKDFTIYYNGVTANAFTITNPTTTTDWVTNSATSLYLKTTPIDCTSVSIDITSTITTGEEKAIGLLVFSDSLLSFDRLPSADNYEPELLPKQVVHQMSDGGTRIHTISEKWNFEIKYKYINETFKDNLKTVWDMQDEFMFAPFETGTSWDGVIIEAVWPGSFQFYKYSDNAADAGYSGKITLMETAW